MSGQGPRRQSVTTICPHLKMLDHTPAVEGAQLPHADASLAVDKQWQCVATATPFSPSTVHQSSCCMNSANYMRCPYFVAVGAHEPQPPTGRPHSRTGFWQQLRRFLPFGRTDRKHRRRVYYI